VASPDQQAAPNGPVSQSSNHLDWCVLLSQESQAWPAHRLGWKLHASLAHSRSRRFSADLELSVQLRVEFMEVSLK